MITLRYTIDAAVEHELIWQWLDAYHTMMAIQADGGEGYSEAYLSHRRTTQAVGSHYTVAPREVARTLLPLWIETGDKGGPTRMEMDHYIVRLHNLAGWCRNQTVQAQPARCEVSYI